MFLSAKQRTVTSDLHLKSFARATRCPVRAWRSQGEKLWISNAEQAEIFFVFASVDPSKGYKGITCFVVEKGVLWG